MNDFSRYRIPFFLALILHALILVIFLINFSVKPFSQPYQGRKKIIQAVVVNSEQIKEQMQALKMQRENWQRLQQEKLEKIKKKVLAAKHQQIFEQKRLAQLKAERQAIALKNKQEAEHRARLAALEKKKKRADQKKRAEIRRKHKLALLKKRQELAAQRAKAAARARRIAAKKAKLAALAAAKTKAELSKIDKYKAMIIQAISQNWLVPGNLKKNLSCQLLIKVAPGGVVLNVRVIKTSGDLTLDRSAKTAVLKTSPLPVPTGPLFDKFRTLRLTVKPQIQGSKPVQIIL